MPLRSGHLRIAASRVATWTLRNYRFRRGKWKLLKIASLFLIVEIREGIYVRISDLANPIEHTLALGQGIEDDDLDLFASMLEAGAVVFDAGANIGMYTLIAARSVGPAGQVHSFEPTPDVAARLRANIALNDFHNVVANEVALSDSHGTAILCRDSECDQNSLFGAEGIGVAVECDTLDAYASRHAISRIDVLKIDVEGAEVKVIEGAREILGSPHPPAILLEFNASALRRAGSNPQHLRDLLYSRGYECYSLGRYGHGAYSNVLALQRWHMDRFSALASRQLEPLKS